MSVRPRITGCANVPFTTRFAEPWTLNLLLDTAISVADITETFNLIFCANPALGDAAELPENWSAKVETSNCFVNDRRSINTWPLRSAESPVPARTRWLFRMARVPRG